MIAFWWFEKFVCNTWFNKYNYNVELNSEKNTCSIAVKHVSLIFETNKTVQNRYFFHSQLLIVNPKTVHC